MTGKSYHVVLNWEYNGRNSTATGFYALPWDGSTYAGSKVYQVPNGNYYLKLTVEKALSDGTPASFEVWTSPAFTIQQP